MNCPTCGAETKVLDSRVFGDSVRRRRQCFLCYERFTTTEVCIEKKLKEEKGRGRNLLMDLEFCVTALGTLEKEKEELLRSIEKMCKKGGAGND